MQIKSILTAVALAAAASCSFAATGTAAFVDGVADYVNPAAFSGGTVNDIITFTGLAVGKYDITLDFSGQGIKLSDLTVNGLHADSITTLTTKKNVFSFASLENTATSPFTLNILGTGLKGVTGSYSGSLTAVAAVPEPETYALMLAGLASVGFVARRRKSADKA